MDYGLIGSKLGHSYSPLLHKLFGGYEYELLPLAEHEAFSEFMIKKEFKAINVTIPYKKAVLEYVDDISEKAGRIGAANTVVNRGGRLFAYNTDFDGFLYMMRVSDYDVSGKNALILGTGGTSLTVFEALRSAGVAKIFRVSRSSGKDRITYKDAEKLYDTHIIVNTTPVGMYPDCDETPISLLHFPELEAVFDVVFNPLETRIVAEARSLGLIASNGLSMLTAQAKYASEIFMGKKIQEDMIENIYRKLYMDLVNIVLIGMPGCGKTTLGKRIAMVTGKKFTDIDSEIEKTAGKTIPDIFKEGGETLFRQYESRITKEVCLQSGQVIATGGGVVTQKENIPFLRQNGIVVYLKRDIKTLATGGKRPLSGDFTAVEKLYNERRALYEKAAHCSVCTDGMTLSDAVETVEDRIYEIFDNKRA